MEEGGQDFGLFEKISRSLSGETEVNDEIPSGKSGLLIKIRTRSLRNTSQTCYHSAHPPCLHAKLMKSTYSPRFGKVHMWFNLNTVLTFAWHESIYMRGRYSTPLRRLISNH